MSLPKAKILVVVTVGDFTNSASILEICSVLAARDHTIDFATLSGREHMVNEYPFVATVHIIGTAISAAEDEEHYAIFLRWDWNTASGRRDIVEGKTAFDAFWPPMYRGLKEVITTTKPDFIFSDFHVEGAPDVCNEFKIPHAVMRPQMPWLMRPQMPWLMMPQKYIPGQSGPILAESYSSLEGDVKEFVESHRKIALVAFGTHVTLDDEKVLKVITSLSDAIHSGSINSVVLTGGQLLGNKHPAWCFAPWVPQRSLLEHDSAVVFVTHCGASSVNEVIFHGVPKIAMGIFGDQMVTSLRVERSGVAVRLDKYKFEASDLTFAIQIILHFNKSSSQPNAKRMQKIAII
ncbi:UDP-glucosyl transferase family [Fusarium heterosporum]|uniref:UDP-glucosyl transferase family n=1 Tax=Fusarium heterosporum TaxID=42747 RepID=A0A8H5WTL1_FUSHE|nr:UDP-glucosyl transferase family [Fusarium heterosporum]